MNSGRQDFSTSCRQDFRTSVSTEVSTEVSQYWRQSVCHFLEGRALRTLPFWSVLFPMPVSGTGGSPLQIGRRTSGNGTCYSTRFWVPGTWYVSGLSKLCFQLRKIGFVTENSLPARGLKTPPKSSFFTGHPVCRYRFLGGHRVLAIFTRNWLRRASFLHIPAHKNGANPAGFTP